MRTLIEIGEVVNVDRFATDAVATKRRLMGFGHRVYKLAIHARAILRGMAEDACRQSGQFKLVRDAVGSTSASTRPRRSQRDFYSRRSSTPRDSGDLFTPSSPPPHRG